jgi:hypothetical protein
MISSYQAGFVLPVEGWLIEGSQWEESELHSDQLRFQSASEFLIAVLLTLWVL